MPICLDNCYTTGLTEEANFRWLSNFVWRGDKLKMVKYARIIRDMHVQEVCIMAVDPASIYWIQTREYSGSFFFLLKMRVVLE
jgi:hypothetical protein